MIGIPPLPLLSLENSQNFKRDRDESESSYSPKKKLRMDSESFEQDSIISLNYYHIDNIKVEKTSEIEMPIAKYESVSYKSYETCDSTCFCAKCHYNKTLVDTVDVTENVFFQLISEAKLIHHIKTKSKGATEEETDEGSNPDGSNPDFIPSARSDVYSVSESENSKICDEACFCYRCFSEKATKDYLNLLRFPLMVEKEPNFKPSLDYSVITSFHFEKIADMKAAKNNYHCNVCKPSDVL